MLRRLALAGMVALLVGGAPLAQTPEPAQDDVEAYKWFILATTYADASEHGQNYVCSHFSCQEPVNDPARLDAQLTELGSVTR